MSNKDRDKRNRKKRSKKDMTRKYDHYCIGKTKYNENENIPCHCHNIIYKERICTNDVYQKEKMRGRRPRHYDDNGLSFTSSVHHLPRRLKSLKKRSGLNCSSLFLPNYLFIVVSKLIPKSQQTMGRMELKIKSSRRNVRIRFRRFVRFNFFPFPFEQLYRLVTPMETGHSIEFKDMETISFWFL